MKHIKKLTAATAVALTTLLAAPASAALVDMPVAANAYISKDGLDWAWARPLPGGIDFSYQGQFGWRLPTLNELLASAPLATEFQFDGANVAFNGSDPVTGATFQFTNANLTGDAACAAAYFSEFRHCDWGEGLGQPFDPWAGMPGASGSAEQLVVRDAMNVVPLPGALGLMLSGLVAAGAVGHRKKRQS